MPLRSRFRRFLLYALALAILAAIAYGLVPEPIEVDLAEAERGARAQNPGASSGSM